MASPLANPMALSNILSQSNTISDRATTVPLSTNRMTLDHILHRRTPPPETTMSLCANPRPAPPPSPPLTSGSIFGPTASSLLPKVPDNQQQDEQDRQQDSQQDKQPDKQPDKPPNKQQDRQDARSTPHQADAELNDDAPDDSNLKLVKANTYRMLIVHQLLDSLDQSTLHATKFLMEWMRNNNNNNHATDSWPALLAGSKNDLASHDFRTIILTVKSFIKSATNLDASSSSSKDTNKQAISAPDLQKLRETLKKHLRAAYGDHALKCSWYGKTWHNIPESPNRASGESALSDRSDEDSGSEILDATDATDATDSDQETNQEEEEEEEEEEDEQSTDGEDDIQAAGESDDAEHSPEQADSIADAVSTTKPKTSNNAKEATESSEISSKKRPRESDRTDDKEDEDGAEKNVQPRKIAKTNTLANYLKTGKVHVSAHDSNKETIASEQSHNESDKQSGKKGKTGLKSSSSYSSATASASTSATHTDATNTSPSPSLPSPKAPRHIRFTVLSRLKVTGVETTPSGRAAKLKWLDPFTRKTETAHVDEDDFESALAVGDADRAAAKAKAEGKLQLGIEVRTEERGRCAAFDWQGDGSNVDDAWERDFEAALAATWNMSKGRLHLKEVAEGPAGREAVMSIKQFGVERAGLLYLNELDIEAAIEEGLASLQEAEE